MTVLDDLYFNPSRGGHAPHSFREAFLEAIDLFESWRDGEPEPRSTRLRGGIPLIGISLIEVTGLLWNCTDTMPIDRARDIISLMPFPDCDTLKGNGTATYAQGARALRRLIEAEQSRRAG